MALGLVAVGVRRLFAEAGSQPQPGMRSYRVDATILLFSIPIFTRAGVGRGYAHYAASGQPDRTLHKMEFAAGSLPERAHGLNRLGMIRETSAETGSGLLEARYFGFMTASREESLGEARKALNRSAGQCLFLAIEGQSQAGEARSRRASFYADARVGWGAYGRLQREAEAAIRNPAEGAGETSLRPESPGGVLPTFLFALWRAIHSPQAELRQTYVYSGNLYTLETSKKPDRRTGRRPEDKGLTTRPQSVTAISGTIHNLRTKEKTQFRIWTEEGGGPVPLRIEYQPRGFLRLALEAEGR
jgi:hypothetical protein